MKQFVMICNEGSLEVMKYVTGGKAEFLEVQGLPHADEKGMTYNILVTPTPSIELKVSDVPEPD